jgi:putative intracellular protease/amidase
MGAKVLAVVTSHDRFDNIDKRTGLWLGELTHFHERIREAGHEMDVVSPRGGAVPIDEDSLGMRGGPQGPNRAFRSDPQTRALLEHSKRPDEVSPGDYQAIYFAGGHGAMWDFPDDSGLIALAEGIHRRGGIVSSVCHGAAGLLNLRDEGGLHLVDGRRVTGYSNTEEKAVRHNGHVPFSLQDELEQRGCDFSRALVPFVPHVVTDGRIVSGQNPMSAKGVGKAVAAMLR